MAPQREAMRRRVALEPPLPEVPAVPAEALPVDEEVSPVEDVIASVELLKEEHPEDETAIDEIVVSLQALADRWAGAPEEPVPIAEALGRLPVL